jgi:hypothetical protein
MLSHLLEPITLTHFFVQDLRSQADGTRAAIHKHRKTFIWNSIYYQLDTFLNRPRLNLMLLEAYFADDLREEGGERESVDNNTTS